MNISRHEQVIQNFLAENLLWQRKGLRKAIAKEMEDPSCVFHLGFIPDAFFISSNCVYLLEVDGHSHLEPSKLSKLLQLWGLLDFHGWHMELITINLFTETKSITTDSDFEKLWNDELCAYALA